MKISFLTFIISILIFQTQLFGQNFEITRIGEHGFCREGNTLYYKLELEVKNNTDFKLKKAKLISSINNLGQFRGSSSQHYDEIWSPQSVFKFELFIAKTFNIPTLENYFDRTPEDILLNININAHNIDKDFDELVSKYNIKDDWKDFQKVLGLRDTEPGEKLKIIKPPVKTENDNKIFNPNNPLELRIDNWSMANQEKELREKYFSNPEFKKEFDNYVEKGIYPPFDDLTFERQILDKVIPTYKGNEYGLVVAEAIVNRNGIVIQAIVGVKGSTVMDKRLFKSVENAVLKTRFEPDTNPYTPENQKIKLMYNFATY